MPYAGVGEATETIGMFLNTEEYIMIKREAYENDNLPIPSWAGGCRSLC